MSSNRPAAEVTDLAKSYGGAEVLRGVSWAVHSGEIFGLLGRNGAGKTTALECMLGLRRPDRGRVTVAGIDALQSPVAARAVVGAQLQAAALQDKLTPLQALRYFASFYERARPINDLLAEFQLEEKANAAFDSLSGGQKQRLFLALAFVHEPAVVVLDEPTAGLDPQARRELHACIVAAKARGVAVILSTHDLDEAEQLCDRVAILHGGTIVAEGSPGALISAAHTRPRLVVTTVEPVIPEQLVTPGGNILRVVVTPDARAKAGSTSAAVPSFAHRAVLECLDVERALTTVLAQLVQSRNRLLEVEIRRPALEDVFFEHTGTPWRLPSDLP